MISLSQLYDFLSMIKGLKIDTLENKRKRYDYFKEIITNADNKVLSHTCFKNYFGLLSLDEDMIEYTINSPKFYEIVANYKNAHDYVKFDKTAQKLVYKDMKKVKRDKYIFLFCISVLPPIILISFFECLINDYTCLIAVILITLLGLVGILRSVSEIINRTDAIYLVEKLEYK